MELARQGAASPIRSWWRRSELLARLALEDNDTEKRATRRPTRRSRSTRGAQAAWRCLATIDWLARRKPDRSLATIRTTRVGDVYLAGHFFVLNRRYEEGIALYRKAIELDPAVERARRLGINLMRLGAEEEARGQLEMCYDNGYREHATVNTLRLMDSYKNFVTFKTDNTILRLHKKEAELLRPYFEAELKRAIATYEKKYKLKLDRPVQFEVYPDHEDFAVRTMGMPGLGALGVTFGYVVAMDSPSGRKPGTFHWASTLWHELSHVFVLTATKHRVPRWFTEGMAVHEETAVSPDWGDRLDPEVIAAIKDKKLLPVAELDRGFVRPKYPAQVVVSYFQAGRICDYINEKWGYDKLLDMMHAFATANDTPEVIRKRARHEAGGVRQAVPGAGRRARPRAMVDDFDDWRKQMKEARRARRSKEYDDVIDEGRRSPRSVSGLRGGRQRLRVVAEAYLAKRDKPAAIGRTGAVRTRSAGAIRELLKQLAKLLEEAGSKKEAAAALDRLNYIYPMDESCTAGWAICGSTRATSTGAIREYGAVLAASRSTRPRRTTTWRAPIARRTSTDEAQR